MTFSQIHSKDRIVWEILSNTITKISCLTEWSHLCLV